LTLIIETAKNNPAFIILVLQKDFKKFVLPSIKVAAVSTKGNKKVF
jgi:hypothetical protein